MTEKKRKLTDLLIIISHRLPAGITSDCELESETKKSKNNGATILVSPISSFNTKPNSNSFFSELGDFNAHCLFLKLMVLKNPFLSSPL